MSSFKLYSLGENNIGIWDAGMRCYDPGICTGLSVLWCKQILINRANLYIPPSNFEASILQAKYEVLHLLRPSVFLRQVNLEPETRFKGLGLTCFLYLITETGVFLLSYEGHMLAAAIINAEFFLFEPEVGLFKYPNGSMFRKDMSRNYKNVSRKIWRIRQVKLIA